jgi:hypothetical protein
MKPIYKMTQGEAEKALAAELRWKSKGLSYSTRRIGAILARLSILKG